MGDVSEQGARKGRRKPGERRQEILWSLAELLKGPVSQNITTASIARHAGISEAALYRHFASKAQMFDALIGFIESSLVSLLNKVESSELPADEKVITMATLLLSFSEKNPGLTRVLTGTALVSEDSRLQQRMAELPRRIQMLLKQAVKLAIAEGKLQHGFDSEAIASIILAYVEGRWLNYVMSGFKLVPTTEAQQQVRWMLRTSAAMQPSESAADLNVLGAAGRSDRVGS